jgi:hypothetical protein
MNDELQLPPPDPSFAALLTENLLPVVDLVIEICPPGTPAPPRPGRPNPLLRPASAPDGVARKSD